MDPKTFVMFLLLATSVSAEVFVHPKQNDQEAKFYLQSEVVATYASEFLAEDMVKEANELAQDLLRNAENFKNNWNYGNAIHHANLVLGRIRLRRNDMAEAKEFLQRAGAAPGSPQLDSFGPNMTLAKELLEKKEKDAVLVYLDEVHEFWSSEYVENEIRQWKQQILEDQIPDFGANLSY